MIEKDLRRFLETVPPFDAALFPERDTFARVGSGSPGGKAQGLAAMRAILESRIAPSFLPDIRVSIPPLVVITSELFDLFMRQNHLAEIALSDRSDDQIARAFRAAVLPPELMEELRQLVNRVQEPLAVRSSSLLEDAVAEPFANVYATRMVPNNEPGPAERLATLADAVRFVYASTYFRNAKNYVRATGRSMADEKMAVILQEVVGSLHGPRFYPHISGIVRSLNFYPMGLARPEDGLAALALGLGRTIVEEGVAWSYSPAYPHVNPPYRSAGDLLEQTQKEFWAIDMSDGSDGWGAGETETLIKCSLADAEQDGALRPVASTYRVEDDRIVAGVEAEGPRIVDFAPILKYELIPLNRLLKTLLKACEEVLGGTVEIEFAASLDNKIERPARFGFLQLRPMTVSQAIVDVPLEDLVKDNVLVASESVLGNGVTDTLRDVVYVKPDRFQPRDTPAIAQELEMLNRAMLASGRPYILIGFGRWGTTDPQCGIPVAFGQICGAKVVVESTLPGMHVMLSQGAHFFHNLIGFRAVYFSVEHSGRYRIDWDWLGRQNVVKETRFVRHVSAPGPLVVRVDGRRGRGVISYEG